MRQILLAILVYLICSVAPSFFGTLASYDMATFQPLGRGIFSWYQAFNVHSTTVTVTRIALNPTTVTEVRSAVPTTITIEMATPTNFPIAEVQSESQVELADVEITPSGKGDETSTLSGTRGEMSVTSYI